MFIYIYNIYTQIHRERHLHYDSSHTSVYRREHISRHYSAVLEGWPMW